MHLYSITRGIKNNVDQMIRDLQAQYFTQSGLKNNMTQLAVRPIQLWEFVFPREHLNTVLATLHYRDEVAPYGFKYHQDILRRSLRLKRIPKIDYANTPRRLLFNKDIGIHHIGIKEDVIRKGIEML